MPPTDPEPENYSIDDMMDRLRSRGEGADGEAQLVTRDDGTQVYRMRKRKRRSHQPKKDKEQRKKTFRVVQVVLAVGLVVLTAAGFLAAVLYLNSGAYRDSVVERIRTWSGAEAKVTELRVTPVGAAASSLELTWPEGSALESLKLGGISGDLQFGRLLAGKWKGNEMYAANGGTLVLRMPAAGASKVTSGGSEGAECPFHFRYRSSKFTVLSGDPAKPAFRVKDSEASLEMLDPQATAANLQLDGGSLQVAGWGEYGMSFASLQFEGGKMRVGKLRLVPANAGKGEIRIDNPGDAPLDFEGGTSEVDVRLFEMPLTALLGPSFGSWLSATVETPENAEGGKFSLKLGKDAGMSLRVPFRAVSATDTEAEGLPMFEVLATQLQEPWYQRPRFEVEARGEAVKSAAGVGVENLNLEARGRLLLTGKVHAKPDGSLDGTLEVGLPAPTVANASSELRAVFSRKAGGYLWASVKISGNARSPQDNLEALLGSSAATVSPAAGGNDSLEDAFKDLTTPAAK